MQEQEVNTIYTIGHSNHTPEHFNGLLLQNHITAVVDVRSIPSSKYAPQFSQNALKRSLKTLSIKYVFLGDELGARSDDPTCYVDGRVQYAYLAKTDAFDKGIERVINGANEFRVALMCTEKDPLQCHRTLLVSRALEKRGVTIKHILWDGTIETNAESMQRLLKTFKLQNGDLLRSSSEILDEALLKQEKKIAFVNAKLASTANIHP